MARTKTRREALTEALEVIGKDKRVLTEIRVTWPNATVEELRETMRNLAALGIAPRDYPLESGHAFEWTEQIKRFRVYVTVTVTDQTIRRWKEVQNAA